MKSGDLPGIDGLSGEENNPVSNTDPSKGVAKVNQSASYINTMDPNHGMPAYMFKLFGEQLNFVDVTNETEPTLSGFYEYETTRHDDDEAEFVMQGFSPDSLPITVGVAKQFGAFNNWYASLPGPSWPGHMYALTGTSAGCTETGVYYQCESRTLYPQKTIFESLLENGHEWMMIYNDSRAELYLEVRISESKYRFRKVSSDATDAAPNAVNKFSYATRYAHCKYMNSDEAAVRTHNMDAFFHAAEHGELPALTWISPRESKNSSLGDLGGPNSDHPSCCDVALGERLRKDIYEAVRASPNWNETLLLFMWDDAGGFYDHVTPPMSAPAPDDEVACTDVGFKFDRLGSRLPVVMASPWLPQGTVERDPPENEKFSADSKYDSTSLVGTLKEIFSLDSYLTRRDEWSGSFAHLFEVLNGPENQGPLHLPEAQPRPG